MKIYYSIFVLRITAHTRSHTGANVRIQSEWPEGHPERADKGNGHFHDPRRPVSAPRGEKKKVRGVLEQQMNGEIFVVR